jgi:prepilin-type N-terminal cleavage/methylation domain-containing protein
MKPLSSASRRAAGFSLIELLVVMLLMGVLMAIGLPNLFNYIFRQKVLGITQQTAILLRLARLEAIKTANNSVVQIDTAAGTVTAFSDLDQDKVLDNGERVIGKLDLPKGITFGTVFRFKTPPTPAVAIFRSDGSADVNDDPDPTKVAGAFLFLNTKGDQLRACLLNAKSGRIVVQKLQGTNWKAQGEDGLAWTWN